MLKAELFGIVDSGYLRPRRNFFCGTLPTIDLLRQFPGRDLFKRAFSQGNAGALRILVLLQVILYVFG